MGGRTGSAQHSFQSCGPVAFQLSQNTAACAPSEEACVRNLVSRSRNVGVIEYEYMYEILVQTSNVLLQTACSVRVMSLRVGLPLCIFRRAIVKPETTSKKERLPSFDHSSRNLFCAIR